MDYTELLKEIIYNQQVLYGFICFVLFVLACYYLGSFLWAVISYFKKRRFAKITRKNLEKLNEDNGSNKDNVND